ncbi:two-component sensor histidine kinase [Dulcicalothrix desertica PCC 7102]|uniref:histidine kinase n=1 Tax=Dulcicalothrix desertica PCC 7102 TaxID=232991 RepID=A0A3S1AC94_9CYAN|nr:HAMP domain-containing sensor histidine kinase [Dulcicalothrix desertica]RUS97983.1 two-component sensor histidine kinase [Dulcicalothrix desertica PCC 7102]
MSKNLSVQKLEVINRLENGKGFFWAARTRILLWYVVIISFIFAASIPAFRQALYARVNVRVHEDLEEKIAIFKELISEQSTATNNDIISEEIKEAAQLLRESDQRLAKFPSYKTELKEFFDAYLGNQLPQDDTFLIVLTDGKFYKSSPRARPAILDRDSRIIRRWALLTQPQRGEIQTEYSDVGDIIYSAKPVKINGIIMGVFVVAHTTAGERAEVLEAVSVVITVSSFTLFVALVLAWFASGKILAPLRALSKTARKIGESDLNQRIAVKGEGELAELATTFNEMMDRLQAAFISQINFINDAGHELRTPITIISGHLELMDNDNPEEIEETLVIVMDELDRMSRFVNDLVLLAKAERPDFLQLETVCVQTLTEGLFIKAKALAERNWLLESVCSCRIVADRQRLTQAIMNLAQNATQHTKNTDTIAIGSAISKGEIKFWVRDSGEGISLSDQQRIFERFARAANSRRRSEGAGLGLSIVQAIAEAHGGKIILESQLGTGATFTIVLPLKAPLNRTN